MNNRIVSVIIPVYKVEKYLQRCVDSVLNQNFKNYEIILVDDGSPDNCPIICDKYAANYDNVSVIHKANGGLSSARNEGIRSASGEYILFVDSDDWIDKNTLKELTEIAEKTNSDFVRFRPKYAGWPGIKDGTMVDFGTEPILREGLYDRQRIINMIYPRLLATTELTLGPIVAAWRSLYKRELLINNDLFFSESIQYSEDVLFSARLLLVTDTFYYLDGPRYYNYFYNSQSITKSFRSDRWESHKRLIREAELQFSNNPDFDFSLQISCLKKYYVLNALNQRYSITDRKVRMEYCKEICLDPVTKNSFYDLNRLNITRKLMLILLIIKYRFYWLLAVI